MKGELQQKFLPCADESVVVRLWPVVFLAIKIGDSRSQSDELVEVNVDAAVSLNSVYDVQIKSSASEKSSTALTAARWLPECLPLVEGAFFEWIRDD